MILVICILTKYNFRMVLSICRCRGSFAFRESRRVLQVVKREKKRNPKNNIISFCFPYYYRQIGTQVSKYMF